MVTSMAASATPGAGRAGRRRPNRAPLGDVTSRSNNTPRTLQDAAIRKRQHEPTFDPTSPATVAAMTLPELRVALRSRGMDTAGNLGALKKRLLDWGRDQGAVTIDCVTLPPPDKPASPATPPDLSHVSAFRRWRPEDGEQDALSPATRWTSNVVAELEENVWPRQPQEPQEPPAPSLTPDARRSRRRLALAGGAFKTGSGAVFANPENLETRASSSAAPRAQDDDEYEEAEQEAEPATLSRVDFYKGLLCTCLGLALLCTHSTTSTASAPAVASEVPAAPTAPVLPAAQPASPAVASEVPAAPTAPVLPAAQPASPAPPPLNIADEKVLVQAAAHAWRIEQLARLHVHFERQEDTILALQHSVAELRVELDSERRTAHGLAVQSWATAAQVDALAAERDALETRQASHLEMIETLVEMEAEEHRRRLELEAEAEQLSAEVTSARKEEEAAEEAAEELADGLSHLAGELRRAGLPSGLYACVAKARLKETAALDSNVVGSVAPGQIVEVMDAVVASTGQVRIKVRPAGQAAEWGSAWGSVLASDGRVLFKAAQNTTVSTQ